MNIRTLGDETLIRMTRPEERVETRDAGGQVISDESVMPAEFTMVDARGSAQGKGVVMPILLAVGAAWLLAKG